MKIQYFLVVFVATCLAGDALGEVETRSSDTSSPSRHFFRGHQVPSLVAADPLVNELHELRDFTVTSTTESPSAATKPPDIEQALIGPFERQLEDVQENGSDNSSETPFTSEPIENNESQKEDETTSTTIPSSMVPLETSTTLSPPRSLPYTLRSTTTTSSQKRSNGVLNKKEDSAAESVSEEHRLLELLVKLAEHPAQWERVHHELEHLNRDLLASRRAVQLLQQSQSHETTTSSPQRLPDALVLENEADRNFVSEGTTSSQAPSLGHSPQQHYRHGNHNKQWPQFAYHRVTASPAVNSPSASVPPGRHRSAFVAVSAVTPAQQHPNKQPHVPLLHVHEPTQTAFPDAMDTLLSHTSPDTSASPVSIARTQDSMEVNEENKEIEQLVQRLQASTQHRGQIWTHERHRDQMEEQLRTLEAIHAQIESKWRELESVRSVQENGQ